MTVDCKDHMTAFQTIGTNIMKIFLVFKRITIPESDYFIKRIAAKSLSSLFYQLSNHDESDHGC